MKKIASLFGLSLLVCSSFSQSYIKPRAINFDPNTCNNTVVLEFYNFSEPDWAYYTPAPTTHLADGDTIENWCFYAAGTSGSYAVGSFLSNGYLGAYMLESSLIAPNFDYTITAYTAPTDEASQDGSVVLEFNSAISGHTILLEQENGYNPPYTFPVSNTLQISSANEGYLTIVIVDPLDDTNYASFRIYMGDVDEWFPETGMDMGISVQHAGFSCTGWIALQPLNLSGSYYNAWSDNVSNTQVRTDLCPGVYGVYSYELVGGSYGNASTDTIVITNDSLTYVDTNLFSIIPQDTTYYIDDNCTFDYFAPIDSVFYSEDTISFVDPLLIATYELIMYQGNNMVTITDTLVTVADSTVLLDVVIYCDLFKSIFKGQRILFLRGADEHYFVSPYLSTEPAIEKIREPEVYPNPSLGEFVIDFGSEEPYRIEIYNLSGALVYASNSNQSKVWIDLQDYPSGVYLLKLTGENGLHTTKLIVE